MQFQSYERPLTLFDLLGAGYRYKWRFFFITLLLLLIGGAGIFLFPRKYESEAKLVVRLGRTSAALDPTTVGQTISILESRDSEMNSMLDLLASRGLSERVVDQVGVDRILQPHSWVELQIEQLQNRAAAYVEQNLAMMTVASAEGEVTPEELKLQKRREAAIRQVSQSLRVTSPKRSTTIGIAYRGSTPGLAQDVVRAVIDCYHHMHIEAYRSDGTLDFFLRQLDQQTESLRLQEDMLKEAKSDNAIVTMQGKQQSLQSEITNVKQMILTATADLEAAKARVTNLGDSLRELPAEMVAEKSYGNPLQSTDFMRDRLYQLEIQEQDLAARFVASHPDLKRVREQLQQARQVMNEQKPDREQNKTAVNPVRLEIQNELLIARANVDSLQARIEALRNLDVQLNESLSEVNRLELISDDLQRQIDVGRENYRMYARKLEESKMNAALDREALSNLSVVNPPSLNYKAASPNRGLLALLAGMFAVCCGFGTALMADYKARSRELEEIRLAEREHYLLMLRRQSAEAASAARVIESGLQSAATAGHLRVSAGTGAESEMADQAIGTVEATAVNDATTQAGSSPHKQDGRPSKAK